MFFRYCRYGSLHIRLKFSVGDGECCTIHVFNELNSTHLYEVRH